MAAKKKNLNVVEQLMALKSITSLTGAIHQAQIEQLKYWIHIAFPHATKYGDIDISVPDEDGQSDKIVRYHLEIGKKKAPRNFKELLHSLALSIHDLLGGDWKVEIFDGEKKIFNGVRKVPNAKEFALAVKDFNTKKAKNAK